MNIACKNSIALIIFSHFDSDVSFLEDFHVRKNDRFIILNVRYLWHSTIFANTRSNSLQKFFSSFSSFSSSSSQISVHSHDCRVRYELNAFTNKSSRSRILSIDEKKKSNELIASKRSWDDFDVCNRSKDITSITNSSKHSLLYEFLMIIFSIFCFDAIIFALLTVRTYDAWRTESCQKHFQKLLFDLTELRRDNKMQNNKMSETRMHANWLTRFSSKFSILQSRFSFAWSRFTFSFTFSSFFRSLISNHVCCIYFDYFSFRNDLFNYSRSSQRYFSNRRPMKEVKEMINRFETKLKENEK